MDEKAIPDWAAIIKCRRDARTRTGKKRKIPDLATTSHDAILGSMEIRKRVLWRLNEIAGTDF